MMFGTPSKLFDGATTEQQLYAMLDTGYARRCFFGATCVGRARTPALTAEQIYELNTSGSNHRSWRISTSSTTWPTSST